MTHQWKRRPPKRHIHYRCD